DSGPKKGRGQMTFPDRRLDRPLEPPEVRSENTQDVIPQTERNQDPEHTTHQLVTETSRPLTDEERKAADRDAPVADPVYAPATERVPRTVAGYRDVTEHTDTATPERQALGQTSEGTDMGTEPTFARVSRPETGPISGNEPDAAEGAGWNSQ